MTVGSCPYLELEDGREEVVPAPSPHHRCCVQVPHQRVGVSYQAEICLTPACRHCPHMQEAATGDDAGEEHAPATGSAVRQPELSKAAPAHRAGRGGVRGRQPRRPIAMTEVVVLSLGSSIVFASFFFACAIAYRLRIGPGMDVAPMVAGGAPLVPVAVLPTLVPTFTPTPLSTETPLTPAAATSSLPTPVPQCLRPGQAEPVLPLPTPVVRPPATSPPTRLVIGKISVDIPVQAVGTRTVKEMGTSKLVWDDVPRAGGFHETSAYPGNPGNTVINGHRDMQGAVFRHLDKLEIGDEIVVYVGDVAYPYLVSETMVVPETFATAKQRAENLKYIGYMPEERLTLVTCTPIGLGTHRLLVIARPPGQIVPQMPEAGSDVRP